MDDLQLLRMVERLVQTGATRLGQDLKNLWPNNTECIANEANLTLHVGRAFIDAGWSTFAESTIGLKGRSRIDLVSFDLATLALLGAECKNLGAPASKRSARSIVDDSQRLNEYCVAKASTFKEDGVVLNHKISLLLALCYRLDVYDWWWSRGVRGSLHWRRCQRS